MRIMLLCIVFMTMHTLHAQDRVDSYGKIEKADLELKSCDFDSDAEAYCLLDIGEVSYNVTARTIDIETYFRKRIKILKQEGTSRANIKIRYYSKKGYEDISNINGIVYNLDDAGNIVTTKLEKSLIYDKKIDDKYSEISFALPDVKVGSVVEYKYKSLKIDNYYDIDDWYFQSDIPVKYSAYNLKIPDYFDFSSSIVRRQPMDDLRAKKTGEGHWYIMRNIPSLKSEPYMAGYRDYLQRVDFQLSGINFPNQLPVSLRTTWNKLSEELMEAEWFGKQLNKNVPGTSGPLKPLLESAKNDREKIAIIYKFVQNNMSWNGLETRGSYDGIKGAWDKKSGSSADINLLLANLLKDNGIKAYPLLVSTRDNGKVNTLYPFLGQFNTTYVFAQTKDGDQFVLNGADKYNAYDVFPYDVQLTSAFIVDRKNPGMVDISDLSKKLRHVVSLWLAVEADGTLEGNATVYSYDYGKNIRRKTYKDNNLRKFFESNEGIKIALDSFTVEDEQLDSMPLKQRIFYKGNMEISDGYGFLPYNLFSGLEKNPFVAEKRTADIDFGFNQSFQVNGTFSIPEGYEYDELPKNLRMILPDSSIVLTRMMNKTNNLLSFRVTVDFFRAQYEAAEYPDVKEVYKKIFAILNERVVIKKKKA